MMVTLGIVHPATRQLNVSVCHLEVDTAEIHFKILKKKTFWNAWVINNKTNCDYYGHIHFAESVRRHALPICSLMPVVLIITSPCASQSPPPPIPNQPVSLESLVASCVNGKGQELKGVAAAYGTAT